MRLLAILSVFILTPIAAPAAAQDGQLCSSAAHVSWQADWDTVTVALARVDVPGCADGEPVGIQLLTDDGDVPADGPIMGEVEDERALFDLSGLEQRVEPVTGVRVFLEVEEELIFFEITVDRHFFNAPGSEQRGLRQTTVLHVQAEGEYHVPGAPAGYMEIDCDGVDAMADDAVANAGAGTFTATESGRHLACYQQTPGPRGGPPPTETEVLAEVEEMGEPTTGRTTGTSEPEVDVLGISESPPSPLARTGANLLLALGLGSLFLVVGLVLVRRREAAPA